MEKLTHTHTLPSPLPIPSKHNTDWISQPEGKKLIKLLISLPKLWQEKTTNDDRSLRSLKKNLNSYGSAKEAVSDPFFSDLFVNHEPTS